MTPDQPKPKEQKPKEPSSSEWKVLRYVWEHEPSTAREISEALEPQEGWASSTVKTLLRRLVEKGHLRSTKGKGVTQFRAMGSAKRTLFGAAEELLRRTKEDTVGPLIAHLVKRSSMSSGELEQLRKLVEQEQTRRKGK